MAWFASQVKSDWGGDPDTLVKHAKRVADLAERLSEKEPELRRLCPEQQALLLKGSISPLPLHKTLALLDILNEEWIRGVKTGHP